MKICRVKPTHDICCECLDMQIDFGEFKNCDLCKSNIDTYELLSVGTSFWSGDYAMVQKGGKIEKVSLKRVYGVKEVS